MSDNIPTTSQVNTYWVQYHFTCQIWDYEDEEWSPHADFDSWRFTCLKRDIKNKVTEYIRNNLLNCEKIKDLQVSIDKAYVTTDYEV